MKSYWKSIAMLILLVAAAGASEYAMARGGHGGSGHGGGFSHGGGHGHGHGVGVGIAFGFPYYWPGYYGGYYGGYPYGYGYPGPAYAYPELASGTYVEQGASQGAPAQAQDWYYCADSKAYYPYVAECPGGWQRVPSRPQR
jgi:hypothetical protein